MKMSINANRTTLWRCYCPIQDEAVNLNEIAKIIADLNSKVLRLRNEVSALKNVDLHAKDKLLGKLNDASKNFCSRCCEKRLLDISQQFITYDVSLKNPKVPTDLFRNNTKTQIVNKILKGTSHLNNSNWNEKLQIQGKPLFEGAVKTKRKRISRGTQCDSTMERKRKRNLLNWFKRDDKEDFSKRNKKMKLSPRYTAHSVDFKCDKDGGNFPTTKKRLREEIQTCVHAEGNIMHKKNNPARKLIGTDRPGNEEFSDWKIVNDVSSKNKEVSLKDVGNEHESLEHSINRMGGGAEVRVRRLISDFTDKVQKINFYKNVKLDARNVKRRLDACIVELNEIIEDVSLIIPK